MKIARMMLATICFGICLGCEDGNRMVTPPEGATVMTDEERDAYDAKLNKEMLGVMADEPKR